MRAVRHCISASLFAALLLAMPGSPVFAQPSGKTITIRGRVLNFDQEAIPGDPVLVSVTATGAKKYMTSSDPDGSYRITINLKPGEKIEYVVFKQKSMHPTDVTQLSGVDETHIINKLMPGPFFADPCPDEYNGLFDQLLILERLYYRQVATRQASEDDLDYYRTSLRQVVGPGSATYARMGPEKADLLAKKRAELFRLYGLDPGGDAPLAALGLCGKCTLHLTDECQSAFIMVVRDQPVLYFIAGGGGGSRAHELVCHTSTDVLVKGKVVRGSSIDPGGKVLAGEFQSTSFEANPRPPAGETLIAGVGKCGRCDYNASDTCQNVIEAKIDSKPTYYWLERNGPDASIHMSGQTYLARGRFEIPRSPAPNRPDALSARFRASQVTPLIARSGAR